jgi:hypothetical protein
MDDNVNFDAWLDAFGPEDEQDRDDLRDAITNRVTTGVYGIKTKGGQLFVSRSGDRTLAVLTDKARDAFLLALSKIKLPDELDVDFERAVNNPNS